MKKILLITGLVLLLILICTIAVNAQVSSWRNNPPQPKVESPRVQPSVPQRSGVSEWRTQTAPIRPGDKYELPQPTRRVRVQNWNNPNPYGYYFGAYGWYQPFNYIWYDQYGWRQRSVIHVYENGRRDTIPKKPLYFTAGLGHTNNKQTSFWGAIGRNKGYFILDYIMSYDIDQNQYYPYGRINEVDFPLSKNDFIKQGTLYVGGGKRFDKLGVHGMIGFGNEVIRYQGRDALGGISFPKSNSNFTTFKFGIIRDFKFLTLKLDRDPIRNYNQISIGLNNK
jgi:hypothetical protein